jgi:hypothetical protein
MAARRRSRRSKTKPGDGRVAFVILGGLLFLIVWNGSSFETKLMVGGALAAVLTFAGLVFWAYVVWQAKRLEAMPAKRRARRTAGVHFAPPSVSDRRNPRGFYGPIDDGDGHRPRRRNSARHDIHEPIEPEEPLASTFDEDEAATITDFLNGDIDHTKYQRPRPRRRRSGPAEGVFFDDSLAF